MYKQHLGQVIHGFQQTFAEIIPGGSLGQRPMELVISVLRAILHPHHCYRAQGGGELPHTLEHICFGETACIVNEPLYSAEHILIVQTVGIDRLLKGGQNALKLFPELLFLHVRPLLS